VIIWLNGPHGVGKTTTAGLLVRRIPGARIFDPENVGYLLRPTLSEPRPVPDYREWPPWRAMVARAAVSIHSYLKSVLVMAQTVPEQDFWHEIRGEIEDAGIELAHVTLIADEAEHLRRIDHDSVEPPPIAGVRRSKIELFRTAMGWLESESAIINTTSLSPEQVADRVIELVHPI
jgi:hypothetical protein